MSTIHTELQQLTDEAKLCGVSWACLWLVNHGHERAAKELQAATHEMDEPCEPTDAELVAEARGGVEARVMESCKPRSPITDFFAVARANVLEQAKAVLAETHCAECGSRRIKHQDGHARCGECGGGRLRT